VYRSRHNTGGAIDLNFYKLETGELMDMGTKWDHFSAKSHIHQAEGHILQNRLFLQEMLGRFGFCGYETEWWHFELPNATDFPVRDLPYGADEAPENVSILG
jgi:D-alanyl-D-alanine dipeptidase